ncbi:hypothetical protein EYF80_042520 [Liparis tanakae]|uniref:Uncharacterized protein n=1 Tax=Liparis tanakae TaxID=230148 RepID=A0A4Z2G422_9TELE|nr:hypothetical protein EYF80_042520 [Liparis tanakae]
MATSSIDAVAAGTVGPPRLPQRNRIGVGVNKEAEISSRGHHGYSGVGRGRGGGGVEKVGKGRRMSKEREREEVQIERTDGAWMIARGKGRRGAALVRRELGSAVSSDLPPRHGCCTDFKSLPLHGAAEHNICYLELLQEL